MLHGSHYTLSSAKNGGIGILFLNFVRQKPISPSALCYTVGMAKPMKYIQTQSQRAPYAAYDMDASEMLVEFPNGSTYSYPVSLEVFGAFLAGSSGQYFQEHIRKLAGYRRLNADDPRLRDRAADKAQEVDNGNGH